LISTQSFLVLLMYKTRWDHKIVAKTKQNCNKENLKETKPFCHTVLHLHITFQDMFGVFEYLCTVSLYIWGCFLILIR